MDTVRSVNGVPIRLTDERWDHVATRHEALKSRRQDVLATIEIQRIVHESLDIPSRFEYDYDREADVLYVTFERGVEDDSIFTSNDLVLRYSGQKLLSVTILHASQRANLHLPQETA